MVPHLLFVFVNKEFPPNNSATSWGGSSSTVARPASSCQLFVEMARL
jgi:hypothetical protein